MMWEIWVLDWNSHKLVAELNQLMGSQPTLLINRYCDAFDIFYYKPITNTAWVRARLCILKKGCTRLAAASDKIYQLLAHGRWFSGYSGFFHP
jgi:hypothetical protein